MTGGRRVRRAAARLLAVRTRVVVALVVSLVASSVLVWNASQAAFTATTDNSGNSINSGTVVLGDNDAGSALFTMSNAKPGDSQTKCVNVAYTGTLGAQVRVRTSGVGTLAPYLTLTVTRGTFSSVPGSGLCTGFTGDSTNYTGNGAGVVYNGLLSAFPTTWAAGVVDPSTTTSPTPEVWTTNENHAYQLTVTLNDDNNAQGKTSTPTFTWEARDASDAAAGSYYGNAVLADTPSSFWRLDETVGTTATDSTGGRNGTYTGSPTLGAPGAVDGNVAPVFSASQKVTVPFSAGLNPAQFSIEAWVKPTGGSGTYRGVAQSWPGCACQGYLLAVGDDDKWQFLVGHGTGFVYTISPSIAALNTWSHVVATFDGTTPRIYVNGTLVVTGPVTTLASAAAATPFEIGKVHVGSLDEVAIYSSALTPTQVQSHYNARN